MLKCSCTVLEKPCSVASIAEEPIKRKNQKYLNVGGELISAISVIKLQNTLKKNLHLDYAKTVAIH